jgi:hypothetical protein
MFDLFWKTEWQMGDASSAFISFCWNRLVRFFFCNLASVIAKRERFGEILCCVKNYFLSCRNQTTTRSIHPSIGG